MKIVLIIAIFAMSLLATDLQDLKTLVQTKSDQVIQILKDKDLSKNAKYKEINLSVNNLFDYKIMAMLSLGKKGRRLLDKTQKQEFIKLFTKNIKHSYFDKSDLLTDKKITVKEAKKEKSRIFVIAEIISPKETNELIYKFHKTRRGEWLIYDIEIAGVSIMTSYRKRFEDILKTNNPQKLLNSLNQ